MKISLWTGALLCALIVVPACVKQNDLYTQDGGTPEDTGGDSDTDSDGDSDGDSDSDSDSDPDSGDGCTDGAYEGCNAQGDVVSYDSCDAEQEVIEECADVHGECVETGDGTAVCGCVSNWDPNEDCMACVTGWGGDDCLVCEVGYTGAGCADCQNEYTFQGGECVYTGYCGTDRLWTVGGDLPETIRLASEFSSGGTLDEPVVVDDITGLQWRRCLVGEEWDGETCDGDANIVPYVTASLSCSIAYGGHSDWRLPEITELRTLLNISYQPSFALNLFDGIGLMNFWSTSESLDEPGEHHYLAGYSGIIGTGVDSAALCVRGGKPSGDPPARFAVGAADGSTLLDTWTDLEWRRCAVGQDWDGVECTGDAAPHAWSAIDGACSGAFAGHSDWFAPSVTQLRSLELKCSDDRPYHREAFVGLDESAPYWTTTEKNTTEEAFVVDFSGDGGTTRLKALSIFVLCARENG